MQDVPVRRRIATVGGSRSEQAAPQWQNLFVAPSYPDQSADVPDEDLAEEAWRESVGAPVHRRPRGGRRTDRN